MIFSLSRLDRDLRYKVECLAARHNLHVQSMIEKILFCFFDTKTDEEMIERLEAMLKKTQPNDGKRQFVDKDLPTDDGSIIYEDFSRYELETLDKISNYEKLEQALKEKGEMSRTEISGLFSNRLSMKTINRLLFDVVEKKFARIEKRKTTAKKPTTFVVWANNEEMNRRV